MLVANVMSAERELYRAFRETVRAKLARDVADEQAAAQARRERVRAALESAVAEARRRGSCGKAWLFGSYAWGAPGERSDVDLLVDGCPDPESLASIVGRATGTDVHVVCVEDAPDSLRERVVAEGLEV